MTTPDRPRLSNQEFELRKLEIEITKRAQEIEFAKFGFRGTLAAAIFGMGTFIVLVGIQAYTGKEIHHWVLLGYTAALGIGCIIFGCLSLWVVPSVAATVSKAMFSLNNRQINNAGNDEQE